MSFMISCVTVAKIRQNLWRKLILTNTGIPTHFMWLLLQINNLDSDMQSLFKMAGISNEVLEDDDTRKQIYDVIEKQGGLNAVKEQMNMREPPPPPSPSGGRGKTL